VKNIREEFSDGWDDADHWVSVNVLEPIFENVVDKILGDEEQRGKLRTFAGGGVIILSLATAFPVHLVASAVGGSVYAAKAMVENGIETIRNK